MIRAAVLLVCLIFLSSVASANVPKEDLPALEQTFHGHWHGGACMGEITLRADGTFERKHYTPGNNTLSGTWEVRRDGASRTLILNCTKSDAKRHVRKVEAKLVRLDDEVLAYAAIQELVPTVPFSVIVDGHRFFSSTVLRRVA